MTNAPASSHLTAGDVIATSLGDVRGRVSVNQPLGARSWFRVGGPAECLFQPADTDDLVAAMQRLSPEIPVTTLGACSNVIIRDGGIPGLVIRLGGAFAGIEVDGNGLIVGGAALDATVAETSASKGLGGLEFLAGIPGSIGGAVRMNAGAYGSDMAAVLDWAEIVFRDGTLLHLEASALRFGYRRSALPDGAVVVRARLRGEPTEQSIVSGRIAEIRAAREGSQPVRARTGGSTFRNPSPDISDKKAWQLVDRAGCRGLTIGGAQISEKHCNFMLNTGDATAADLEALGEEVRKRVLEKSGVNLQWEIKRIGLKASETKGDAA